MKKAIIDIDGVLNYYPNTLVNFINHMQGTEFEDLHQVKLSLSFTEYRRLKSLYINSDYKYKAEIQKGAREMIEKLIDAGHLIYIVTSRQLFSHNQLEKTILWLKENGIKYDYIYYSIKKDFTIYEKFGHVDFVIEDNVENLKRIEKINGSNCVYINVRNLENKIYDYDGIKVHHLIDTLEYIRGDK